jgi:hypothetical protein
VVGTFLIGYAFLLLAVGCSGTYSETSNKKKEQGSSPKPTASKEEAKCEGTRRINVNLPARFTTNDLPGCPKGGLLLGTDKGDNLAGEKGDDEVRGLGGSDGVMAGPGNDVIYSGPGNDNSVTGDDGDDVIYGGPGNDKNVIGSGGDDVIYGGPGDDNLSGRNGKDAIYGGPGDDTRLDGGGPWRTNDGHRDEIYCGEGRDSYWAEKIDYVDSSCEKKLPNSARGSKFPPKGGVP